MILKKNSTIPTIYGLALLGLIPSAVFAESIVKEKTAFEYSDSLKNRCLGKNNKPEKCLSQQENYIPETKVDKYIINSAMYATKFVPLLNQGASSENFTNIMFEDGKNILVNSGYNFANSIANTEIQKIPFFAQTSINLSGGTESDTSFSLNSLMKLRELAKDDEGDIKTLAFSQARFATATNAEGSTSNLGFGIRHRPNDFSMLGANAFWDYRMTSYSNAHSRLGLGGEYLWKDLEFRNNWYMAITDEKEVTFKGSSYKERVVDGWDLEIGYRLPNYPELAFYVRGFNWDYKNTQDNSGVEASINWQAKPNFGLEAWISNEISAASLASNSKLPGVDETFFGLRINITGNPIEYNQKEYKKNMITQMTQPVKRKYDVLLERSGGAFTNRAKGS
tara:strand:+ start:208 stop:1389 length:1182 start_codon:yes stop_codon:yes gene_type:complete